jgi:very-short-patch-repair endonuclease
MKRVKQLSRSFFKVCTGVALGRLKDLGGRELANLLSAYAKVRIREPELFQACGDEVIVRIKRAGNANTREDTKSAPFNERDIATIAQSFATLHIEHPEMIKALVQEVTPRLESFPIIDMASFAWALGILHPDLVSKVCSAEILDRVDSKEHARWLQLYQALLSAGLVPPHARFERLDQVIQHHGKAKRSSFELAVESDLSTILGVRPSLIETQKFVAGIEVDLCIDDRLIVECDGNGFHFSCDSDGRREMPLGPDILQDRIFALFGYDVIHIRSRDFSGSNRFRELERIKALLAQMSAE